MSISMLFNMPGEEGHSQVISEKFLADHMIQVEDSKRTGDVSQVQIEEHSVKQCLRALSIIKRYALAQNMLPDAVHACFGGCNGA